MGMILTDAFPQRQRLGRGGVGMGGAGAVGDGIGNRRRQPMRGGQRPFGIP